MLSCEMSEPCLSFRPNRAVNVWLWKLDVEIQKVLFVHEARMENKEICGKEKQDIYCITGTVNDKISSFLRYIIETLSHT